MATIITEKVKTFPIRQCIYIPMSNNSLHSHKELIRPLGNDTLYLFDIDNTLYKKTDGLLDKMLEKVFHYASHFISDGSVRETCEKYYNIYGLSVKGLLLHHKEANIDLWKEIFNKGINVEQFLKKDSELKAMIQNIKGRKYCFTNADSDHSKKVLKAIGLDDCFEGVIHSEYEKEVDFICKPHVQAFNFVETLFGVKSKEKILFFDDSPVNINSSFLRGWKGYFVDEVYDIKTILSQLVCQKLNK